ELRFSRWDWTKRSESDIIRAMFYFGPDVRDHGIEEMARRGKSVLPGLQKTIELNPNTTHFVRDSVWIATRIDEPEARQFVRSFVNDKELSVKLSALHSVGLHRDVKALPSLLKIVAKDHPAAQRQAATALGRIKHADAIAPIMEAVPEAGDRFLEHALIYALIQIDHRDKTAAYLNDRNPLVRRAALLALDQMPNGNLTRDELAAQFNSDSKALTRAALDIVASRPKWAAEIKGLLADWLSTRQGNLVPRETLTSVLLALSKEPTVQDLMAKSLAGDGARSTRLIVLEVMGRAPLAKLPPDWTKEIGKALDQNDEELVREAITVLRTRGLTAFDRTLDRMVLDFKRSPETRLAAFGALAMRGGLIGAHAFEFLLTHLKNDQPPLARLAVAKGLSQAKLEENQLQRLTTAVASAGPIELPMLLAAYEKNTSLPVGLALLTALEKNASLTSLTPGAIEKALKHVPDDSRYRVQDLAKRLNVDAAKQKARLDELMPLATGGSIEQGRDIYFGNKAACSTCHAINNKGGGVGPDLGKIGAIRSGRDLLESIAFPSVSFARGFEPYVVETKKGKTYSGILSRESSDAVYLMTTERVEIRVGRDEIETFAPGRVSIMPQGLDAQLTRRELQDLLAYLQSLR
ncbi:MAG: c-type cytochrome, partial [Planctomycetes bacterium]|nr:c-type cytochrome [Planctomycetota bacterium]